MTAAPLSATDMRDAFFGALYDLAVVDRAITILSNDFGAPSLDRFRADLPDQFINAAISEQNMVSTAAGMALGGHKVIVYSIASFVTLRALEQIKIDVCVMKAPVMIVGVGCGYAYSVDGPTHHATEDIAVMRAMPGMTILSPSEPAAAAAVVPLVANLQSPHYLRLDRGRWPMLGDIDVAQGCRTLRRGANVALVATGIMVHRAVEIADCLAQRGLSATVIDLFGLKPVNAEALLKALGQAPAIATIEEQGASGGLGGLVAELLADHGQLRPLKRFAIADELVYAYGDRKALHGQQGLDAESAAASLCTWLNR